MLRRLLGELDEALNEAHQGLTAWRDAQALKKAG
jgi:hypothetical protein